MTSKCYVQDISSYEAHEHYCGLCNKWWRCRDKKCVKLSSSPCKKHQQNTQEKRPT